MKTKMKKAYKNIAWWIGVATVGIVFGVSLQFASAWVNPPAVAPPGGNLGAPINTGSVAQNKSGRLTLSGSPSLIADNAVGVYGLLKAYANMVVEGTLRVVGADGNSGSFQFKDGNQGNGKVLVSNNNGEATWGDALDNPVDCIGDDKALQWDEDQWVCKTLSVGISCPCGTCWNTRSAGSGCYAEGNVGCYVIEMCTPAGWKTTGVMTINAGGN